MKILALISSFIFGPQIWGPIIIVISLFKSDVSQSQITILLPFLLFGTLGIPFGYILYAYKKKIIKDLDMTNRLERFIPLTIIISSLCISTLYIYILHANKLGNLFLLFTLLMIVNGIITIFWKISLHMAINVLGTLLCIYLYGSIAYPILITIPIIFWSRLFLKRHTFMQVIISLLLNGFIIYTYLFTPLFLKNIFHLL